MMTTTRRREAKCAAECITQPFVILPFSASFFFSCSRYCFVVSSSSGKAKHAELVCVMMSQFNSVVEAAFSTSQLFIEGSIASRRLASHEARAAIYSRRDPHRLDRINIDKSRAVSCRSRINFLVNQSTTFGFCSVNRLTLCECFDTSGESFGVSVTTLRLLIGSAELMIYVPRVDKLFIKILFRVAGRSSSAVLTHFPAAVCSSTSSSRINGRHD